MAFIEKLDGPALNLSPEEFEGYMLRQVGPFGDNRRQQVVNDTQQLLEELSGRQEKIDQGMDALSLQLQNWVQTVNTQLDETTAQFAQVQKEITAQAEVSQMFPSLSYDALAQGGDKVQSVLEIADEPTGPKDTDC